MRTKFLRFCATSLPAGLSAGLYPTRGRPRAPMKPLMGKKLKSQVDGRREREREREIAANENE